MLASVLLVNLELILEADSHALRNCFALILVKQFRLFFNLFLAVLFAEVQVQMELKQTVAADGNAAALTDEFNFRLAARARPAFLV